MIGIGARRGDHSHQPGIFGPLGYLVPGLRVTEGLGVTLGLGEDGLDLY